MASVSPQALPPPEARPFALLRWYARTAAVAVTAIGVSVLYGWAFGVPQLLTVVHGLVTMKANTALSLAMAGISLWLLIPVTSGRRRRLVARVLALGVALIGTATLSQYLFGWSLGIDQFLFQDRVSLIGTTAPGRLAPTTAVSLVLIGASLLLLDGKTPRSHRLAQAMSLFSSLIALIAITGYVYRAVVAYKLFLYTQVALHTAIALFLLSVGIFVARPRSGIAGDFTGSAAGSVMARRFLPAVLIVPIFLGWVCLRGLLAGLYGSEPALALYATVSVVVFASLLWLSARQLNREFDQRSGAQDELRRLNAELEVRVSARTRSLAEQSAVLSEQAALLDLAQDAIIVSDMQNRVLFWSQGAEALFGWTKEEAIGKNSHELLQSEFEDPLAVVEARLLRTGRWEGEVVDVTRGGAFVTVASRCALQRDAEGEPVRTMAISNDVSNAKAAEAKLLMLSERLSLATAVGKVGVWERDLITGRITFDPTMFEIYGLAPVESMTYESYERSVHRADQPLIEAAVKRAIDLRTEESVDFRVLRPDGSVRIVAASMRVLFDGHGNLRRLVGVNVDITERKHAEVALRESEAQMAHAAEHDFLTGLPNRLLVNDRIKSAILMASRHDKHVGVLFLDLDGFKHINDSLGHPVGDRLLRSVASRLADCVRGSDTVSRQGGDEFVVLLSEMERAEDAAITAKRMLLAVAKPHLVDGRDLHVTVSIGVSVYPGDGKDAESLIRNADTAMYQAKENGRQSFQFFKPAMNVRAVERQSIEESLRRALERKELALHYQPMVDLRTGEITGAEALVRWTHPTRGLVSPAQFIPVAEECGLILPIGNWVLREACRQARQWLDAGLSLGTMAVNISSIEFLNEDFLEGIFAALDESGLEPSRLELELTESVLMRRPGAAELILETLRSKGVQLAIDDFGTGYSSLSYLRKFQVDSLKIDQSFIRQMTTSPDQTSIVPAVISMGQSLKLRVVAEGVETLEELHFLQAHDCDQGQGYYFGRPIPPHEFAELLATGIAVKDRVIRPRVSLELPGTGARLPAVAAAALPG